MTCDRWEVNDSYWRPDAGSEFLVSVPIHGDGPRGRALTDGPNLFIMSSTLSEYSGSVHMLRCPESSPKESNGLYQEHDSCSTRSQTTTIHVNESERTDLQVDRCGSSPQPAVSVGPRQTNVRQKHQQKNALEPSASSAHSIRDILMCSPQAYPNHDTGHETPNTVHLQLSQKQRYPPHRLCSSERRPLL